MPDDSKVQALTLILTQWERLGVSGLLSLVLACCCFVLWRRVVYLTEALMREQERHIQIQDARTKEYIHATQQVLNEFLRAHLDQPQAQVLTK